MRRFSFILPILFSCKNRTDKFQIDRGCLVVILALLFCSCEQSPSPPSEHWQEIAGRTEDRHPIYRTIALPTWKQKSVDPNLEDTMKPICEYCIEEQLKVVVHNFPSDSLSQRIPPQAQIARWQRQSGQGIVTPECQNGFIGLRLEAPGLLGYAMQMDPELYLALTGPQATALDRQRRADYTIKATGPQDLIEKHRIDLETFAHRFELIEPIDTDS